MYTSLDPTNLKDGTSAELGIILGPDEDWADRVDHLLGHKSEIWQWQNATTIRQPLELECRYAIASRDGLPFANVATFEHAGVGILGHVFTQEDARGKGAASALMTVVMHDFKTRGGRALYLGTAFDSPAFHIYRKHGFAPVEPGSGEMVFHAGTSQGFNAAFFDIATPEIGPPSWTDWAMGQPLFTDEMPGRLRCMRLGVLGRTGAESGLLAVIREHLAHPEGHPPTCLLLRDAKRRSVAACATWSHHRHWPHTIIVDLYSHPHTWDASESLLAKLQLPPCARAVAYVDEQTPEKAAVLEKAGFRPGATFHQRIAADLARSAHLDVTEYVKQ
jgi:GNAT superfamily N-acetyltransferase